jgi:DNA-binding NarL/FixJ family response regulator
MRMKSLVLSISSDHSFRPMIELVLSKFGMSVKSTSDPKNFLDCASRLKPDLYLIDFNPAEMMGFELIEAIREIDPAMPVVIVSDASDKRTISHALELGADDFIVRPLDRAMLVSKLSQFITTEQLTEELSGSLTLPKGTTSGRITIEVNVQEIDELGIKFMSPHLFPKGTVLRIKVALFSKMGLKTDQCLVVVTNTYVDAETDSFCAYAEFDGVDPDFLQTVRQWLAQNSK